MSDRKKWKTTFCLALYNFENPALLLTPNTVLGKDEDRAITSSLYIFEAAKVV